jgi:hypothetical protein
LSVLAGVGQTSELMQSYNNVAQLGHFRGATIGREPAKQLDRQSNVSSGKLTG